MAEGSAEQTIRRAYEAFNTNDAEALAKVVADDFVMDWSRSIGPEKGVYRGLDGATDWMNAIREAFDNFELTPTEFIGSGEQIVVRTQVNATGRGSGVEVNASGITVWVHRGGRLSGLTLYQDEQEAFDAAGL